MSHRERLFAVAVAGFAMLAGACNILRGSGAPVGNDNSNQSATDDDDTGSGVRPPECDIPFEGIGVHDIWTVSIDPEEETDLTIMITGRGGTVESINLEESPIGGISCYGDHPEVNMVMDNGQFRLDASFESQASPFDPVPVDDSDPVSCSISLSGTVSECGADFHLFPGYGFNLFSVDGEGVADVGGHEHIVSAFDLLIMPGPEITPCENEPTSLENMTWTISAIDLAGFSDVGGPVSSSFYLDVVGMGENLQYASVEFYPSAGSGSNLLSCYADMPSGSMSFDGSSLFFELELADPLEPDASCLLSFEGSRVDCHRSTGLPGVSAEVVLQSTSFTGTGSLTSGGETRSFGTVFFSVLPEDYVPGGLFKAPPSSEGALSTE